MPVAGAGSGRPGVAGHRPHHEPAPVAGVLRRLPAAADRPKSTVVHISQRAPMHLALNRRDLSVNGAGGRRSDHEPA